MMLFAFAAALAYLFGSIPVGAWVAKAKGINIQSVGSGGTGATNVQRVLGYKFGLAVALFDGLKGAIALWVAMALGLEGAVLGWVGLAAVLGHNYSCFLKFSGGKGVATSVGVFLVLFWPAGVCTVIVGITTMALGRMVSLGSMVGALANVMFAVAFGAPLWVVLTFGALGVLVFWTHKANIERLAAGTERRLGERIKQAN